MKRVKMLSALALSVGIAAVLTGCHNNHGDLTAVAVADYSVVVDPPRVKVDGPTTTISGTLHRQPGSADFITGRLDIDFVAPDGDVLDSITCCFNPKKIPSDPGATSSYEISYGVVFPKDTKVQVKFVDSATAEREDADNGGPGAANGAATGGGGHSYGGGGHGGGGGGGEHATGGGWGGKGF